MAAIQYNRVIRKMVVGFGNLFNNITLVRYNKDESEAERMLVPIVYATKEYYVRRLEEDLTLDKKVQVTLPRMSFEMTGLTYDNTRKQNSNIKNFANTPKGVVAQYNPVPYNFDFSLYIYVRNTEDGTQIIEHILPFFTPDYTIKLNLIPEMGIIKEVPVVLNSVSSDYTYEGTHDDPTRTIIWTLNFTVKGFVYGKTSGPVNVIKTAITNIYNNITEEDEVAFNMAQPGIGNYQLGEVVYQGFSYGMSTATAKVIMWSNGILKLSNLNGNFVSNQPIYGVNSNANYQFQSYNVSSKTPSKYVTMTTVANPNTAMANNLYTFDTFIQEENGPTTVMMSSSNNHIVYVPPAQTPPSIEDHWYNQDIDLNA